jgi:hypothetical protein
MSEMDIYGDMAEAFAGMKSGLQDETETFIAGEKIYPGDPLFGTVGDSKKCYRAHVSAIGFTASAELVAGNKVAVTVNGVSLPAIQFINSTQETLRAIVNAVNLNDSLSSLGIAAFIVDGSPLSIYFEGPGITLTASATVTEGASQATFSSAAYTNTKFVGIARHQEMSFAEGSGFYPEGVAVSAMTRGKIWVPVADDSTPVDKEEAYVVISGDDAGKFTDNSGTENYDCGCYFRSGRIKGNIALVEVRGMK